MNTTGNEILTIFWMGGLATMVAASAGMLGVWLYNTFLEKTLDEMRDDASGGAGARNVVIGRLGALNRRFMWPGYEIKVRRNLIKGGEPQRPQARRRDGLAGDRVRRSACSSACSGRAPRAATCCGRCAARSSGCTTR